MPIEAKVIPTWHAAMYSSMCSIWRSASFAPRSPSLVIAWMRSSRERTRAYSVATKNAFIRTSAGTPTRRTTSKMRPPEAAYFEEVLGRASASDRRLPEPTGGTERVIKAGRTVSLVLPDRQDAAARAGDPRPPGVAAARTGVAQETRSAALHAAAHRHGAHHAPARARVLERDQRATAARVADRGREGGHLTPAVRVDLVVPGARGGDVDVVLLVWLGSGGVALAPVRPGD